VNNGNLTWLCSTCGMVLTKETRRYWKGKRYCASCDERATQEYYKIRKERLRISSENAKRNSKRTGPATAAVHVAVKKGILVRQPCEVCGATKYIDAHHEDYTKPLSVRWLCRSHHRQTHTRIAKLNKLASYGQISLADVYS
jgi:uncharacterized Zn finger protein (UPF0148 family)